MNTRRGSDSRKPDSHSVLALKKKPDPTQEKPDSHSVLALKKKPDPTQEKPGSHSDLALKKKPDPSQEKGDRDTLFRIRNPAFKIKKSPVIIAPIKPYFWGPNVIIMIWSLQLRLGAMKKRQEKCP